MLIMATAPHISINTLPRVKYGQRALRPPQQSQPQHRPFAAMDLPRHLRQWGGNAVDPTVRKSPGRDGHERAYLVAGLAQFLHTADEEEVAVLGVE